MILEHFPPHLLTLPTHVADFLHARRAADGDQSTAGILAREERPSAKYVKASLPQVKLHVWLYRLIFQTPDVGRSN